MLITVIRISRSRADFVTKMFARNASQLATDPSGDMRVRERRFFDQDQDLKLVQAVAEDLPSRVACVYRWLAGGIAGDPRYQKPPTGRRSVCEKVSVFCNPSASPRLDPSLATCDEAPTDRKCKTAPLNNCCLYFGHGWLRDDVAFRRLRDRVATARVECAHNPFPLVTFPRDSAPFAELQMCIGTCRNRWALFSPSLLSEAETSCCTRRISAIGLRIAGRGS